jgi:hypothetical protein
MLTTFNSGSMLRREPKVDEVLVGQQLRQERVQPAIRELQRMQKILGAGDESNYILKRAKHFPKLNTNQREFILTRGQSYKTFRHLLRRLTPIID